MKEEETCKYGCGILGRYQCSIWGSLCQIEQRFPIWNEPCTDKDFVTCPLNGKDYHFDDWNKFKKWCKVQRHDNIDSFKAGMKEVVDWVENNKLFASVQEYAIYGKDWQAKLKEWGIK